MDNRKGGYCYPWKEKATGKLVFLIDTETKDLDTGYEKVLIEENYYGSAFFVMSKDEFYKNYERVEEKDLP